jgi:hypothetical protein
MGVWIWFEEGGGIFLDYGGWLRLLVSLELEISFLLCGERGRASEFTSSRNCRKRHEKLASFAKRQDHQLTRPFSTAKSKKQRQRAAKALRKRALLNPESLAPKVPMYEQSVDLPGGDGSLEAAKEAGQARSGLTKAMRDKRRKMIKEDNFLRAMG